MKENGRKKIKTTTNNVHANIPVQKIIFIVAFSSKSAGNKVEHEVQLLSDKIKNNNNNNKEELVHHNSCIHRMQCNNSVHRNCQHFFYVSVFFFSFRFVARLCFAFFFFFIIIILLYSSIRFVECENILHCHSLTVVAVG